MLTFEERVSYQRAIEEVYWRHRIWPKERADLKPSLDEVISQAQLEKKVKGYLRNSQALEDYWQRPIAAEQLQTEMDRMAQHTNQPEVLQELFETLGYDPFVIAECLARPALAERLTSSWYAYEESWRAKAEGGAPIAMTVPEASYTIPKIPEGGCKDTWAPTNLTGTPEARVSHTAVWTGSEMIVWGGVLNSTFATNSGGRYDPALDTWTSTSTVNAPIGREAQTAVWTGTEMIVWGGWYDDGATVHILNTGGRYNPAADSWTGTSPTNAPDPRRWHTAVWTGSEMVIWGGESGVSGSPVNTGGRYNPNTDSWIMTNLTNAPDPRIDHTAVWTGSEMIVWGGGPYTPTNTGGRYSPSSDSWIGTCSGTQRRSGHTAVWTGQEMIVWGGYNGSVHVNTGAKYNTTADAWIATSLSNAPDGRIAHGAIWTGNEMIVWGGYNYEQDRFFNTGGRYSPTTDSWTGTTTINAPDAASSPTAVWTGSQLIVWGGFFAFIDPFGHYHSYVLNTGGRYCAQAPSATPIPTPFTGRCEPTPRPRSTPRPRPTPR